MLTHLIHAKAQVLGLQNSVNLIVKNHRDDVQPLSGLRPKRLVCIHRGAITEQREYLTIRCRNGCAHSGRPTLPDRSSGQIQPCVRLRHLCGPEHCSASTRVAAKNTILGHMLCDDIGHRAHRQFPLKDRERLLGIGHGLGRCRIDCITQIF